jgi:hypothetical protein
MVVHHGAAEYPPSYPPSYPPQAAAAAHGGAASYPAFTVVDKNPLGLSLVRSDAAGGRLLVQAVDPAHQCAGMGVRAGDALYTINGRDVASDPLALQRLAERPLQLVFQRLGASEQEPAQECVLQLAPARALPLRA